MNSFENNVRKRGAVSMFLEVRSGNTGAIKLYEKCGFAKFGVRKNYYKDGEDAFLFRKDAI